MVAMRLFIANKDRSNDIGRGIQEAADLRKRRGGPCFLPRQYSALSLKDARNDAEYLGIFVNLLRNRTGLDTEDFDIPRKPGPGGRFMAALRRFLWKLLRYQHDRMAFKQSVVNDLVAGHLEFEMAVRDSQIAALQDRLDELERLIGPAAADSGDSGK